MITLIIKTIILGTALYWSIIFIMGIIEAVASQKSRTLTGNAVIAIVLWMIFYFITNIL